jgi:hypothetical protein
MLIALPNPDGSFTGTLFAPFQTLLLFNDDEGAFRDYVGTRFASAMSLFDWKVRGRAHPLFSSFVDPWISASKQVVLFGDAAHAQVPFFGQGMNAGLEDVLVFEELLSSSSLGGVGDAMDRAVMEYDRTRRPCGEAITRLSLANYEHMHTKAASWTWRTWKRAEGAFVKAFGGRPPLYFQVAFTRTRYDEIWAREVQLDKISAWLVWLGRMGVVGLAVVTLAAARAAGAGAPQTTTGGEAKKGSLAGDVAWLFRRGVRLSSDFVSGMMMGSGTNNNNNATTSPGPGSGVLRFESSRSDNW